MPRTAREKCESGIYHVMLRGINRYDIFHDEEDYLRFLETLMKTKGKDNYSIYAYCLMSNHVHLVLHEQKEEISKIMKRIGVSYAWWYNRKYDRVGHVFQDRFRSESIKDDSYLLCAVRYVHNNPVKAGLVKAAEEYRWSSVKAYYGLREYPEGLTGKSFILGMLSENELSEYTKAENQDNFIDYEIKIRKKDEELINNLLELLNGEPISVLHTMDVKKRNEILRELKEIHGVTQRQIARVTGISQSAVSQA